MYKYLLLFLVVALISSCFCDQDSDDDSRHRLTRSNQQVRKPRRGGEIEEDPTKPEFKILAEQSLMKYLTDNHYHTPPYHVSRVTRATTQIIAGRIVRLNFEAENGLMCGITLKCFSKITEELNQRPVFEPNCKQIMAPHPCLKTKSFQ